MKPFKYWVISGVLCCGCGVVRAQPDTLWTRTYGGSDDDRAYSIQQTTDGGYVVAGRTNSFGESTDFYVVKTDAQGETLWTRTYGGADQDQAYSIQQTTDGGYVIAGRTLSFGAGNWDFYVVKTDAQGDTLWTRTYGGIWNDFAQSIQQTTDGGYVVAGLTFFGADWGTQDFYVVKTDATGDTLWTRSYGGNEDDEASSIRQTTDGGYVIAGYTDFFGGGDKDFYVVKTDAQGDTLWTRTYGGNGSDIAYSIQQTTDGGYVLSGGTDSGAGNFDHYVVKTDAQGDTLWTHAYGGTSSDFAHSIQLTLDGGYVVAGVTLSFGAGASDFYVVKTDANGDTLWTRTYGGTDFEDAYSIQQTTEGEFVVAGWTNTFGAGDWDFYVVNTGSDGPPPPLRLTAPNGGEQWPLLSTQTVTWVSDSVDGLILLELNRNYPNGQWELLADNTPDDNQEEITVSGSFSNACRVRISLIGDTLSDVSSGNFSITNPLYITSPNGGEAWPLFSTQNVTWNSDNLSGTMRIELNRNYPNGTWDILMDNTPDDNQEEIFVTSGTSQNCRVRINLVGDTLSDISDGNFSITTSAGTLRLVYPQFPDIPINFWYAGVIVEQDTFSESFRLKNFGNETVVFVTALEPASDEFSVSFTCDTIELASSEMSTCELSLFFHPQENGQHFDTLLILTNASNQQNGYVRIPMEGELILGAEETTTLPTEFALHPAYPNPFNAETTIGFSLPRSAQIELNVFDVQGRLVKKLAAGVYESGAHSVNWNASEDATGIYFVRLNSAEFTMTQKVVVLK